MPDDWQPLYQTWQKDPTPANLHGVVKALSPTVDQHLARMGMHQDPLLRSKAQLLAADAVRTWDPTQSSSLPTWVGHQMTPLHRFRRISNQVLAIPEGIQLDNLKLENSRRKFIDDYGRDPDEDELADASGLTIKRMRDIRRGTPITPGATPGGDTPAASMTDHVGEAMDAVYGSADSVDRIIMEARMGYNGRPILSTQDILRRTKLQAPQLARRASRLAMQIQQTAGDLEGLYGR